MVRNVAALSIKDVLANQPSCEVHTLKNGFRVAAEDNGKQTATVGVWIETGSRYENEGNNGVAHFLERLMHKGTGKRASKALESELEAIGARMQSYTTRDRTAVFVQSSSQDVEKVVDILADVLRNSKLDSSAIEAEREVLIRELEEKECDLQGVTMDNLHLAAFQVTNEAVQPSCKLEGVGSRRTTLAANPNVLSGQWDVTHATSRTAPSRWVQKISHEHGLHFLQHFNINYKDTGLFGVYFVSNGDDLINSEGIMRSVQHEWKV
ncbi:peptidase, M16 family [Ostertagia ostertagi]